MKELDNLVLEIKRDKKKQTLNESDDALEYARGKKWGVKDKMTGEHRDPNHYPPAFMKGYNETRTESNWDKINAKMTDVLGRLGSSMLKR